MEAGEKDIGERNVLVTTIRTEFRPRKNEQSFKAWKALLELLHQMSKADPLIYIQDREKGTIWANKYDFPSNKEFTENIKLFQESYNDGKVSVFVHFKMVHMVALGILKRHEAIRPYIWKHNIWMFVDHFDTAKVSEPGFIGRIHPNLVNLNNMYIKIENRLRRAKVVKEQVVLDWKEENQKEEDSKMGNNSVPKVIIYVG
eukprot:15349561-Ditylum_brightwellii.AAC.1